MKEVYETDQLFCKETLISGIYNVYDKEEDSVYRSPKAAIQVENGIAWLDLAVCANTDSLDLIKEIMFMMEQDA